jgi:hypothetical protein
MPTGPKGEKRPADVIGNAVKGLSAVTAKARRHRPRSILRYSRRSIVT